MTFTKIFNHQSRVNFVGGIYGVENIVIQHKIFVILKAGDILFLSDAIDYLLVFSEHIVKDDLLAQNIDYLIIVDALRTTNITVLVEPKSLLEGKLHTVL